MTRRSERVAEAIRRLASEIIHSHLKDPRIRGLVTVTKAEVTADLRFAKIYYTTMCDGKAKELVARGLKSAKNYIRKRIGDELKLRFAPDILLRIDKSAEYSKKIDKILEKLNKEAQDEGNGKDSKGD